MRVIITSTQYPGYGGSATNAYSIIKYLRSNGVKCAGLFYENSKANIDPESIGGIFKISTDLKNYRIIKAQMIKYIGGYPTHILSKNYLAPVLSAHLFIHPVNIYLVSGCPHMMSISKKNISALEYMNSNKKEAFKAEREAVKLSHLIVPNSLLSKNILEYHYGKLDKITDPINTSNINNLKNGNKGWDNKKYDIALVCSNFDRKVKNTELAQKILSSKEFKKNLILIAGSNSKKHFNGANCKISDLISHKDCLELISQSKVVLNTSLYDASPNTLKEALNLNSNILTSHNCGWSEKYPKEFIVDDYRDVDEWVIKLKLLIEKKIKYENVETGCKIMDLLK